MKGGGDVVDFKKDETNEKGRKNGSGDPVKKPLAIQ
jgi:hypothetical protein